MQKVGACAGAGTRGEPTARPDGGGQDARPIHTVHDGGCKKKKNGQHTVAAGARSSCHSRCEGGLTVGATRWCCPGRNQQKRQSTTRTCTPDGTVCASATSPPRRARTALPPTGGVCRQQHHHDRRRPRRWRLLRTRANALTPRWEWDRPRRTLWGAATGPPPGPPPARRVSRRCAGGGRGGGGGATRAADRRRPSHGVWPEHRRRCPPAARAEWGGIYNHTHRPRGGAPTDPRRRRRRGRRRRRQALRATPTQAVWCSPAPPPRGQCACGVVCAARGSGRAQTADWAAQLWRRRQAPPPPTDGLEMGPAAVGPPAVPSVPSSRNRPASGGPSGAPLPHMRGGAPTRRRGAAARSWRRRAVEERKAACAAWPRGGVLRGHTLPPSTVKCSSVCGTAYREAGGARGAQHWASALLVSASPRRFVCPPPHPLPGPPRSAVELGGAPAARHWPRLSNCRIDGAPDGCPTVRRAGHPSPWNESQPVQKGAAQGR